MFQVRYQSLHDKDEWTYCSFDMHIDNDCDRFRLLMRRCQELGLKVEI
jgi:hypothetical protein